ncbi:monooxygenase [Marasmius tenuissimus]|uniref:Monooxygenase n=1 Tax=Marasmius tenuissimus TaxID=585030 RepID=A0ABR3A7V0_9AGAR
MEPSDTNGKTICIIGGGPSGLIALKAVLDRPEIKDRLWKPTLFEARDDVGGVWLPSQSTTPTHDDLPETPLYDSLTTNIPHPLMAYTCWPFPPSTDLYPHAKAVEDYFKSFVDTFGLRKWIQCRKIVENVTWDAEVKKWRVTYRENEPEHTASSSAHFDYTIVANGHYHLPRYPPIPGLDDWRASGKLTHSAWYRHPLETDQGKTVLVIGGGASGNDVANEMSETGRSFVLHSFPDSAGQGTQKPNIRVKPPPTHFLSTSKGEVAFADGTIETGIHRCILATGYEMSFPFLGEDVVQPYHDLESIPLMSNVSNTTFSVFPLARHVFPVPSESVGYPPRSIAFLGLPIKIAPFPLVEAQAHYAVGVFANPGSFDADAEREGVSKRVESLKTRFGGDEGEVMKRYHVFEEPLSQFWYREDLWPSGPPTEEWEKDGFVARAQLRAYWTSLPMEERVKWVKGVGESGWNRGQQGDAGGWEEARREWGVVVKTLTERVVASVAVGNGLPDGQEVNAVAG